jgi:UPF0755 protein
MRRRVVRIIVPLALFAVALGGILAWGKSRFDAPGPLNAPVTVIVLHGAGLVGIAKLLAQNGIVSSPWVFAGGVAALGHGHALKAGEYAVPANLSARGLMELLQSGKTVLHKLTVAEGLTTAQVSAAVAAEEALSGPVPEAPGEGRILPETYNFSYGDSRSEIVSRMTKAMDETLAMTWAHRDANLPIKTANEALVLASIVEKETGRPEERPLIAAVFLNRMKKGMKLQSDPTVVYGLDPGARTLNRPLTKADLEKPSPYNTYVIDGLPPGPIANPGRESLLAAVRPAETGDLYFVADGTGGHHFARTLAEHNRNVAKWRKARDKTGVSPSAGNASSRAP